MGLFSFLTSKSVSNRELQKQLTELRASLNSTWNMSEVAFGSDKYAGVTMNKKTALTLSAVYLAINIHADTLNLPIQVYKKDLQTGDKNPVTPKDKYQYKVHQILNVSPSKLHTPASWVQMMEFSRLIYGNAVSYIVRDRMGFPTALKFVHWSNVELEFDGVQLWYTLRDDEGNIVVKRAPYWDVIHVKALSSDGVIGMSPIDQAKESLSFGKATQETGNKFFADGMTAKTILSHPGVLGEKGRKNLDESFTEEMKRKSNIILEEGLKPYILSVTPEQAQFLGSREFSVEEVARWFNMPKFMLANDSPTYSNIQGFDLFFVKHNIRPRARMYEQEFNWKLLGNKPEFYTTYNMEALLRADIKTRFETYGIGIQNRIYSPNEARSKEDLNSYEGGDKYENPNVLSKQDESTQSTESD